ncbi:MAG TPA: AAA family ATPase [Crocinitomicaceae bacterium]|nr:AAA family ATPase [Crocinitomicaceae bacterium]
METNQLTILKAIEKIHATMKGSSLKTTSFKEVESELKFVGNYFQINEIQSVLLPTIISKTYDGADKLSRIANHFDVEEIRLIHHLPDIEELITRKIIKKEKSRYSSVEYGFNHELFSFLSKNTPIPSELITEEVKEITFQQCLSDIDELSNLKDEKEITDEQLFKHKFWEILNEYKELKIVRYIFDNMKNATIDVFVFLDSIIDAMRNYDNNYNTGLSSTVDDCTFSQRKAFNFISAFLGGKTLLNTLNLVEKDKKSFGNRHLLRLTDKAVKMLREWEGIKFEISPKSDKLLYPEKMKAVQLFHNTHEKEQLDTLSNSLSNSAFKQLQKRLKMNNMPHGITALFYGAPGTGKTETAYQLAKKYKRPVFKVEISETKSMWFGESQKLVKKIFTDYYEFKKNEKICPILLFNEADAIISKRKSAGSSNVADTENAIQNILLEELENFDGILFATSNLINNIDSAFERRFLFKIKFDAPNEENAAKIWQSKLPVLSDTETIQLAQKFRFSGGEMENIARKCIMEEVVSGEKATFERIVAFCETEKWGESKMKIGFC